MFGVEAMDFAMQLVSGVLEYPSLRLWNNWGLGYTHNKVMERHKPALLHGGEGGVLI